MVIAQFTKLFIFCGLFFNFHCIIDGTYANSVYAARQDGGKESVVRSDLIEVQASTRYPFKLYEQSYPYQPQYGDSEARFCCRPQSPTLQYTSLGGGPAYGSGFGGFHRDPYNNRRHWNVWDSRPSVWQQMYPSNLQPTRYPTLSNSYPNYQYYQQTRYPFYNPYQKYPNEVYSSWQRWGYGQKWFPQQSPFPQYYPNVPWHYHQHHNGRFIKAKAVLKGEKKVEGAVYFEELSNRHVAIRGRITGLTPGAHGFHIHEKEMVNNDCLSAGKHYNPQNTDHGGKADWVRHVGDLGNILADNQGVAYFDISDQVISLSGGYNVINRTLVVTEHGDDLGRNPDIESKTNGNSGAPVACGVIRLVYY
ncbi:superoxide dismutase-like [Cu-Zn] [Dinothrombium tinctorium]|uniref:superoxide dismutase n=1 Tax=Dinothrombium tinctorium TaxID=1965070 RepID=A0A443RGN9_9ACAR|nr:superoxide dismutase-like [Cu-Zn] [Dinothrombium tinctorium]